MNDGGLAYPRPIGVTPRDENGDASYNQPQKGMTMRQAYKMAYITGAVSRVPGCDLKHLAEQAGHVADFQIQEDEEASKRKA